MKVFVINGYPESGKDQFVEFCGEVEPVCNIVTSTPAKKALELLGWDGEEKTPAVRKALYYLMRMSEELFDGIYRAVEDCLSKIAVGEDMFATDIVVFIHSREPYNIYRYVEVFGAKTVLVTRPGDKATNNPSDENVTCWEYDYYIANDGTLYDLREKAVKFMEMIGG